MQDQSKICTQCREKPVEPDSVYWLFHLPLILLSGVVSVDPSLKPKLCTDCAAGINLLGLLVTAALLIIGFVIVVIMLTR
jgi:hypothetical protein